MNPQEEIIIKLINEKARTRADFRRVVASVYRNHSTEGYDSNIELRRIYDLMVEAGDIEPDPGLEKLLVTKKMRSLSGVSVITVLTKPHECPGKCIYCPTEADVPKSYLSDEPAVMRAILNKYDAKAQVKTRLRSLAVQGHPIDKVELIIIGGTFSYLPRDYQEEFVKACFDALNGKTSKTLDDAKAYNETAKSRCVGLTLETRPDYVTKDEVEWFRYLGATRVELGVQTVFDDVLAKNARGEKVEDTVWATKLLKNAGFKICYHLMPNLYGSTVERDKEMFEIVFDDARFKPDYIKIYPCMVITGTPLYELWQKGEYKSYSDAELKEIIKYAKSIVPYWVRIMRTIRDIPAPNIVSGSVLSNMRQIVLEEMKAEGTKCRCIRCREIGVASFLSSPASQLKSNQLTGDLDSRLRGNDEKADRNDVGLFIDKYRASGGTEYFLSVESKSRDVLYSLLRLRLSDTAIIREVHTYGQEVEVGGSGKIQHRGYGRKLLAEAEKIAVKHEYRAISVISGVGARDYYRKFGYRLEDEYMVKRLDKGPKK